MGRLELCGPLRERHLRAPQRHTVFNADDERVKRKLGSVIIYFNMSRDIFLLLIGAAIALGSSIATALLQHFLSLRAERKKKEWEKAENEAQEFVRKLSEGSEIHLEALKSGYIEELKRKGYKGTVAPAFTNMDAIAKLLQGVAERLEAEAQAEAERRSTPKER